MEQSSTPSIERNQLFDNAGPGLIIRSRVMPQVTGNVLYGNGTEAAWLPAGGADIVKQNFFLSGGKLDQSPKLRLLPPTGAQK